MLETCLTDPSASKHHAACCQDVGYAKFGHVDGGTEEYVTVSQAELRA